MITVLLILLVAMAPALVLVTLMQTLYMESVRVRAKDAPFLELFRERISDRIGLKADKGILTFSLVKHTMLAVLGVAVLAISAGIPIAWFDLAEAAVLSLVVMVVLCYLIPQYLYRRTEGTWLVPLVPLLHAFSVIVRPVVGMLAFLQSLADLGTKDESESDAGTPEENIDALITAGAEEGIIEEDDRKLIQSVVAFGDKTVREVMTPRPSMVTTSVEATLEDLRQLVIHEQFSRIPVYRENIDDIIGFVHVRDMFELDHTERVHRKVSELVRPIQQVPETKPVGDLLRDMQQNGTHMAVVIDEYGSTAGLVTMEDMVEEIVGEIRDEHEPGHDVEPDADGGYIVSGSFDLDHLGDLLQFRPHEETESTTVGGLVTEWMGRVPDSGESVERDGIRIEVLSSNDLRVEQVRISKIVLTNGNGKEARE